MAELTPQGDKIGDLFPVRVTELGRTANIRDAVELLYYGNLSGHSLTVGQEDQIPTQSVAGQFRDIGLTKLNKNNGTTTGKLTTAASTTGSAGLNLPHGTAPTSPVNGDIWTTTTGLFARINTQNYQFALTSATAFADLISIDNRTDEHTFNLAYGNIAAGNTKTVNIGTGSGSAGATAIVIGPTSGSTRTVMMYGAVSVNNTISIGSTASVGGTLSVTGALTGSSSVQGTSFILGSSGPTITTGSGAASGTPPQGSVYLRSGVAYTDALSVYASGGWRKMRGNMWFTGTAAPSDGIGEQAGDLFINRATGEVYVAS
jgi:hypothetical protein